MKIVFTFFSLTKYKTNNFPPFQNYKYYLSFENSVCDDYITEKFFNILKYDVIPITFSGTNFSAIGAPPHSSINVLDFASPKKLVNTKIIKIKT